MRAVNLIPRDGRRGVGAPGRVGFSPTYGVLGGLAVVLVLVVLYVLAGNAVSSRRAKLSSLQAQLGREQAVANTLSTYTRFEQLAQTRLQTVRSIAADRFDWYGALSDLARVVPADTSLSSLYGSVAPGATIGGSGGGAGSGAAGSLRTDLSVPAFQLSGCTKTQDDVARLMSRLRVINGVTRVTLADSQKSGSAGTGTTSSASVSGAAGCGPNSPSFDLVVFFQPLPGGSGSTGSTAGAAIPTGASTTATGTPTTPTGAAGTPTTGATSAMKAGAK